MRVETKVMTKYLPLIGAVTVESSVVKLCCRVEIPWRIVVFKSFVDAEVVGEEFTVTFEA